MTTTTRSSRKRTVFSLTPQELFELKKLNTNVSATVPPSKPRRAGSSYSEYAYDLGIYDRYVNLHERAKYERSVWLREHRVTREVAAAAIRTEYKPYANASRLGDEAPPPMPEGYEQEWQTVFAPKPKPNAPKSNVVESVMPDGLRGFSF